MFVNNKLKIEHLISNKPNPDNAEIKLDNY